MKQLKRTLCVLLSALMLISVFAAVPLTAGAAQSGDYKYSVRGDGTALIVGYTGSASVLEIPGTIDGHVVSSIGNSAFYGVDSLTSVTIPGSVATIGVCAFCHCEYLRKVEIPSSVTTIENYAFQFCYALESIEIPDSVTSIGEKAFEYCTTLENVTIPGSVTSMGTYVFSNCDNLGGVTIGEGITSISEGAFYNCTSLTYVKIPVSVKAIGGNAFSKCYNLLDVYYEGNSLQWYGIDFGYGNEYLTSATLHCEQPTPVTDPIVKDTVYLNAAATSADNQDFYAWIWTTAVDGAWTKMEADANGYYTVHMEAKQNVVFARLPGGETPATDWSNIWNQTGDLVYDGVNNLFTTTGYKYNGHRIEYDMVGTWSVYDGTSTVPTTEPTATRTIYFKNSLKWNNVYAYIWDYYGGNSELIYWPGTAMTKCGTDSDGYEIYKIDIDTTKYDYIIFSNDGAPQTVDIELSPDVNAYYCTTNISSGKYNVSGFNYYEETTEPTEAPTTEPEPSTAAPTTAPTTAAPTTAPATTVAPTTAPVTTEPTELVTYNFYFAPLVSDIANGYVYRINFQDAAAESVDSASGWTTLTMEAEGAGVYTASIELASDYAVSIIQYQVWDADGNWLRKYEFEGITPLADYNNKMLIATGESAYKLANYSGEAPTTVPTTQASGATEAPTIPEGTDTVYLNAKSTSTGIEDYWVWTWSETDAGSWHKMTIDSQSGYYTIQVVPGQDLIFARVVKGEIPADEWTPDYEWTGVLNQSNNLVYDGKNNLFTSTGYEYQYIPIDDSPGTYQDCIIGNWSAYNTAATESTTAPVTTEPTEAPTTEPIETTDTAYFNPADVADTETLDFYAWIWDDGVPGEDFSPVMAVGTTGYYSVPVKPGQNIIFLSVPKGEAPTTDWSNVDHQTENLTFDGTNNLFTLTGFKTEEGFGYLKEFYDGVWSVYGGYVVTEPATTAPVTTEPTEAPTTEPKPSTTAPTEAPTTAPKPTTAAPTEAPTTVPKPTTAPETEPQTTLPAEKTTYNLYFAPLAADVDAGYTFRVNFQDATAASETEGWTTLDMTEVGGGVYTASAELAADMSVNVIQYQVWNGVTWVREYTIDGIAPLANYNKKVITATSESAYVITDYVVTTAPATTAAPTTAPATDPVIYPEPSTAAPTTTAPVEETYTVYFKTNMGWINDLGCSLYMYDVDTQQTYDMVKDENAYPNVYVAQVPVSTANVIFYRALEAVEGDPTGVDVAYNLMPAVLSPENNCYRLYDYPVGSEPEYSIEPYEAEEMPNFSLSRVYVDNSATKWESVYIYGWGVSGLGNAAFPMTNIDGTDIWYFDFPAPILVGKGDFLFKNTETVWDQQTDDVTVEADCNLFNLNTETWTVYSEGGTVATNPTDVTEAPTQTPTTEAPTRVPATDPVATDPVTNPATEPVTTEPVTTEPATFPADAPKFVVSDITAKNGSTITVDVSIENNPGITAFNVTLDYSTQALTLTGVEYKKLFSSKATGAKDLTSPFTISWFSSKSEDETENGVLATLTFEINENAEPGDYYINLTYAPENVFDSTFTNVAFAVDNGVITVIDYIPGDVNGDGKVNMKDVVLLQQYMNNWHVTVNMKAADVNGDSSVNMKDIVLLQQYLNGWSVELKAGG